MSRKWAVRLENLSLFFLTVFTQIQLLTLIFYISFYRFFFFFHSFLLSLMKILFFIIHSIHALKQDWVRLTLGQARLGQVIWLSPWPCEGWVRPWKFWPDPGPAHRQCTPSAKGMVEHGKEINTHFFFGGAMPDPPPFTFLIWYVFFHIYVFSNVFWSQNIVFNISN